MSEDSGCSEVAIEQLNQIEASNAGLYNDVVTICEFILDNPAGAQSRSSALTTVEGICFRLSVPGHHPFNVFGTSGGPRVEAVFPYRGLTRDPGMRRTSRGVRRTRTPPRLRATFLQTHLVAEFYGLPADQSGTPSRQRGIQCPRRRGCRWPLGGVRPHRWRAPPSADRSSNREGQRRRRECRSRRAR